MFGDRLGDPTAGDIWTLAKDRHNGISRSEARDRFNPTRKTKIDRALGVVSYLN